MSKAKFELFKSSANDRFYFRLKAGNGQVILASQAYTAKQSCFNGIASVKENASYDERYERKDKEDSYTFTLQARNGETIGRSESYTSKAARENGVESVKNNAPGADVEDIA